MSKANNLTFESPSFGRRLGGMLGVDFYRLFHTPMFYIFLAIAAIIPAMILGTSGMENPQTGEVAAALYTNTWHLIAAPEPLYVVSTIGEYANMNMVFIFGGIMVSIFIGHDYRSGYVKQLFTTHAKKRDYMMSKTLCQKAFPVRGDWGSQQLALATLSDCTDLDSEQKAISEEMDILGEIIRRCVEENSTKIQNQAEYFERYDRHATRYEKLKKRYEAIEAERQRRKEQSDRLGAFIRTMASHEQIPLEFSDDLWLATVDRVTVHADETVVFTFKSGVEITETLA